MQRPVDIAVISDVHLGTYSCHAVELLRYLKSIKPKTLILNGDFIDISSIKKSYFPKEHMDVLRYILKLVHTDTKVYYITGNHDDALRRYTDFSAGNLHLRDKLVLQLNGQRHWFFHGDIFDTLINVSPLITKLGSKGYDFLIFYNRIRNKVRARFGKPRRSFSEKLKKHVKKAAYFIDSFENTAIKLAAEKEYDYVVCGHIHRPQIRKETVNGQEVTYLNAGDWVESLTALEFAWGKWKIYQYDEADYVAVNPKLRVKPSKGTDRKSKIKTKDILSEILGKEAGSIIR